MDDFITSSFVYDKSCKRFTILNLYDEDEYNDNHSNNNELYKIYQQQKLKEVIEKKEAFKPNKCYCCIIM